MRMSLRENDTSPLDTPEGGATVGNYARKQDGSRRIDSLLLSLLHIDDGR
jgi:hypothetical protein